MSTIYTVGQVNAYIKDLFRRDFLLSRVSVKGEVSNCKYHRSGHIYFSLKDETGTIACVMFAGSRRGLAFAMKDGDKVVAEGSCDVYERDGRYQLYARRITLEGAGLLYERFVALKAELEEMGMFAPEYKQPIPYYVKRLGIVTAPTGAAIRDIQNIALRRNPFIQLILYPALVQGEGAAESIVKGIRTLDRMGLDAIIVGRGGGSIEDLWAFNEESVARAIFECRTPVISAVGHEVDITIADFVADLRAPTPSAAAELAVADIRSILEQLSEYRRRLKRGMDGILEGYRNRLRTIQTRWEYLSPENQIREKRQRLADAEQALHRFLKDRITETRHRLQLTLERFRGLSPLNKLDQGLAYLESPSGRPVTGIGDTAPGEMLIIRLRDGSIRSRVESLEPVREWKEEYAAERRERDGGDGGSGQTGA